MPPKRIEQFIKGLKDGPTPVRGIDAIRERVFVEVNERSFHRGPSVFFVGITIGTLAVVLAVGVTAAAAQTAMPGDRLYPVKRLTETVWLGLRVAPDARMQTERVILERRFTETAATPSVGVHTNATDDYRIRVSAAADDLDKTSDRTDPEVFSAEVESFSDLLGRHADVLDQDTLDDIYVEGLLRANESIVKKAEQRYHIDSDSR